MIQLNAIKMLLIENWVFFLFRIDSGSFDFHWTNEKTKIERLFFQ